MAFFDEMRHSGQQVGVIVFGALVSACEKSRWWQRALVLLFEFQHRVLQLNVFTISALFIACVKGPQLLRSIGVLDEMRRCGLQRHQHALRWQVRHR